MFTHRLIRPLFVLLHGAAILGWHFDQWPWWVILCSLVIHLTLSALGSFMPQAGYFIRHTSHGPAGTLALTYDDGPVPERTTALLDLLRAEGVKATFFCIGERVQQHPELARRIVAEGHTIGVHTMRHPWYWGFLRKPEALAQITDCVETIRQVTGTLPTLFRPPYGVTSPATAWAIGKSGLKPIAWDLRTFDTAMGAGPYNPSRVLRRLKHASIVLMHDPTAAAVPITQAILGEARKNGTTLVPL